MEDWGRKWDFRFSIEKTKVVFFTRKKIDESMNLELYGRNLERVKSITFLGVIFYIRLTWRDHASKVVDQCKRVMNLMRCLAGIELGADVASLKQIYVYFIRARIEYGYLVYGSTAKSVLAGLDIVQNKALRICRGAV